MQKNKGNMCLSVSFWIALDPVDCQLNAIDKYGTFSQCHTHTHSEVGLWQNKFENIQFTSCPGRRAELPVHIGTLRVP